VNETTESLLGGRHAHCMPSSTLSPRYFDTELFFDSSATVNRVVHAATTVCSQPYAFGPVAEVINRPRPAKY
jgi:hypothetical protein